MQRHDTRKTNKMSNLKSLKRSLYFYTIMPSIPGAELFFLDIDYANVHCEFVGLDE